MKKALIVVGPAVEDTEFAYPFYRLQEDGFIVDVASNGAIPIIAKHGLPISCNKDIMHIKSSDYDLLIIPGGLESPDRLRQIPELLNFINEFNDQGKIIASVCAVILNLFLFIVSRPSLVLLICHGVFFIFGAQAPIIFDFIAN